MTDSTLFSRRGFLLGSAGLAGLTLSGCATTGDEMPATPVISQYYLDMYAALPNEQYPVPAVDLTAMNPDFWRTEVQDPTGERPGTIVVNTGERYLYLVGENGRAIRYGVGIGREGFAWAGRADIAAKKQWPTWTPPAEMVVRQPEIAPYRNGMPGGLDNPLGARAMYLYEDGRDTLYRLHGTNDPRSIGVAISSGCVRLINQDVIDLYQRVPVGTHVHVI
ncbi:MAG TPA: L,D-transpeptidase [Devosiaceae bacterium]|jgi:lipoprotein-anchoring transpeptidase ErfK/SrfK